MSKESVLIFLSTYWLRNLGARQITLKQLLQNHFLTKSVGKDYNLKLNPYDLIAVNALHIQQAVKVIVKCIRSNLVSNMMTP